MSVEPKPKPESDAEKRPNISINTDALFRSAVYKRLPLDVRKKVDSAIICRPPGQTSIEAIFKHFRLKERYGISCKAFCYYAKMLEKAARPAIASHFLASALGCLPKQYRDQVLTGAQVILLSQVLAVLTAPREGEVNSKDKPPPPTLGVAELAKLAGIFAALSRSPKSKEENAPPAFDPEHVLQAIEDLYGCTPPREPAEKAVGTANTDELVQNATIVGSKT